jgi:hypothetical protein
MSKVKMDGKQSVVRLCLFTRGREGGRGAKASKHEQQAS